MTTESSAGSLRVAGLTVLALVAFAGNSVLCRLALADSSIDAASFTTVRLVSGAIALLIILGMTSRGTRPASYGSWMSAAMLFPYAACFSFAYISLDTGIGALILFGMVQATMVAGALMAGDRPAVAEWIGWLLAIGGFVLLKMARKIPPRINRLETIRRREMDSDNKSIPPAAARTGTESCTMAACMELIDCRAVYHTA